MLKPIRDRLVATCGLHRESFGHRLIHVVGTFILVDFTWIFFRVEGGVKQAIYIIRSIFTVYNPWVILDGSLFECGLNRKNFYLMVMCIGILLVVDLLKKRGISIVNKIRRQDTWFQVIFVASSIVFILLFGVWGGSFDATGFIYFQF